MHMHNFLCSDSLLYFFLFLSTLHSVYTRDCSCVINIIILIILNNLKCLSSIYLFQICKPQKFKKLFIVLKNILFMYFNIYIYLINFDMNIYQ